MKKYYGKFFIKGKFDVQQIPEEEDLENLKALCGTLNSDEHKITVLEVEKEGNVFYVSKLF